MNLRESAAVVGICVKQVRAALRNGFRQVEIHYVTEGLAKSGVEYPDGRILEVRAEKEDGDWETRAWRRSGNRLQPVQHIGSVDGQAFNNSPGS